MECSNALKQLAEDKTTDVYTAEHARNTSFWLEEIAGGKTVKQHFREITLNKKNEKVRSLKRT